MKKLIISESTIGKLGLGWLLREAMDIDSIYQKYYSKIDRKVFEEIIAADPKTIPGVKIGKYAKVLLKLFMDGNLLLEDLPKASNYLKLAYKHNVPIDITKVNALWDIYNLISRYIVNIDTSFEEILVALDEDDASSYQRVYDDGKYLIVIPKNEKAACWLGVNTEWCTTWGRHSLDPEYQSRTSQFTYYTLRGSLYIVYEFSTGDRYQIHLQTESYMDTEDYPIDYENLPRHIWMTIINHEYGKEKLEGMLQKFDTTTTEGLTEIVDELYEEYSSSSKLSKKWILDTLKDGYLEMNYYNPSMREIDYLVDKQLFKTILQDSIEAELISPEEVHNAGISDFDDLYPYIEDSEIDDRLKNAYNSMYESTAYDDFFKDVQNWAQEVVTEDAMVKMFLFGKEDDEEKYTIDLPYNGYDGTSNEKLFAEIYLNT